MPNAYVVMANGADERLESESGLDMDQNDSLDIYPNAEVRIVREQYSILHVKRLCESRKELVIDPDFQRNAVWESRQKMELVESVLMGIPIPVMYLFEMRDGTKQVVDGRQRITALLDFLNNKFALKELNILRKLNGKFFKDLDLKLQGIFEDYQLFFYIIQPPTPERVKYDIFDRVNRGGTNLNSQEMRNALYRGMATDLIKEIAESKAFKKVTGHGISPKRMKDRYVALRAVAFYFYERQILIDPDTKQPLVYKSDIDDYLAKTMIFLNKYLDKEKKETLVRLFEKAYERIFDLLGEDAFRFESTGSKRRPINMPLMESLTLLFLLNEDLEKREFIKERIHAVKRELDESGFCKGSVDSSRSWEARLQILTKLL